MSRWRRNQESGRPHDLRPRQILARIARFARGWRLQEPGAESIPAVASGALGDEVPQFGRRAEITRRRRCGSACYLLVFTGAQAPIDERVGECIEHRGPVSYTHLK